MALQKYKVLFKGTQRVGGIYTTSGLNWPAKYIDYTEPFYVENIENVNETLIIQKSGAAAVTVTFEYSLDKVNWNTLCTTSTTVFTRTFAPGDKVYLRCNAPYIGGSVTNNIMGVSKIGGNIMSLLYGSNFTGNETEFPTGSVNTFRSVFNNINDESTYDKLQDASELILPATTLVNYCYAHMFRRNRVLTKPPRVLPATISATYCYFSMFHSCTLLTESPEILLSTLVSNSMSQMFNTCSSLNYIKCLTQSGINRNSSTSSWVTGVASIGTFVKKAGVTWPTGNNGIPSGWTVVEQ